MSNKSTNLAERCDMCPRCGERDSNMLIRVITRDHLCCTACGTHYTSGSSDRLWELQEACDIRPLDPMSYEVFEERGVSAISDDAPVKITITMGELRRIRSLLGERRRYVVAADPNPDGRESFYIDRHRCLVRSRVPANGTPYEHRCPEDAYVAIAIAIDAMKGPFSINEIHTRSGTTWTQAAVAFAFMKERGVVVPVGGRCHAAASKVAYEDAMIEFYAAQADQETKA